MTARKAMPLLAVLALAATAPAAAPAQAAESDYAPGEVIVKFRNGVPATERADALRDRGTDLERALPLARTVLAATAPDETVPRGPRGRLLASGARTVDRPAVCSLTARLNRAGRSLLRRSRRVRLTVVLAFAPQGGTRLERRAALTLKR
jgi:hypothetical protein